MPVERRPAELFAAHGEALKNEIRKCLPATVTAVYPARQTVDVVVGVNNVIFDDLGTAVSDPATSFTDVPLGVARGGTFMVWLPVVVGDTVLLIFSDLSCDTWRAGDGSPVDPGWVGKHTTDSPFAMPFVAPDARMFADPASDPSKVIIGKDGGQAQIRVSATDIELGVGASEAVALAPLVDGIFKALSTLCKAINVYAGAIEAIADPTSMATPVLSTALSAFEGTIVSTAATLVKAK